MSARRRLAMGGLVVAVLAVLAVGSFVVINGRADSGDKTPPVSQTSAPVVDAAASPPELKNTGEDWDQIVRSISQYQAWLFSHPRPELLKNIMLPSYENYGFFEQGLTNLATKGWRYEPAFRPATTNVVRLQDRPRPDLAVVFVKSYDPPNRVVDPAGKVVLDTPGAGDSSVLWTLRRDPVSDAHWRLEKVTSFTDAPPRP